MQVSYGRDEATETREIDIAVARLISGVHWFSDIIGGALLSGGLVLMYYSVKEL